MIVKNVFLNDYEDEDEEADDDDDYYHYSICCIVLFDFQPHSQRSTVLFIYCFRCAVLHLIISIILLFL